MFDTVWAVIQKELVHANTSWDEAMDLNKQMTDKIITAEKKLENVLASLDEVVKQCSGKPGKFTPVMDNDRIVGIRVEYDSAGLTVSKTLELDAPSDTQPRT
jgi:hypothetical protein